jgi:hypothetical protein
MIQMLLAMMKIQVSSIDYQFSALIEIFFKAVISDAKATVRSYFQLINRAPSERENCRQGTKVCHPEATEIDGP